MSQTKPVTDLSTGDPLLELPEVLWTHIAVAIESEAVAVGLMQFGASDDLPSTP